MKYTFHYFDSRSNRALNEAIALAGSLGQTEVGTEHLLASLLSSREKTPQDRRILDYIVTRRGKGVRLPLGPENFSTNLNRAMEASLRVRLPGRRESVSSQTLLENILTEGTGAFTMVEELKLVLPCVIRPQNSVSEPHPAAYGTPHSKNLEKYGKNLTQMARQNQLDPCIGREKEVQRLQQILCRRQKNNPCLLGEPGVGKTAVVEGLAQLIAQDRVPAPLRYKQIISLDLTSVVAGTKYRGDFEERVRGILEEAAAGRGTILFIDEVHTIIGAGAAEGAVDAANILKPVLARGGLQLIGATTMSEYHRHIEKDAALERRFQQVIIDEPDRPRTLDILKGLRPRYEDFHHLKIEDSALEAAVDYSIRYIHDRFLPDKAVDLLDEAASGCVIGEMSLGARRTLGEEQIAETVARWVGVPVEQLTLSEKQRLLGLEKRLQEEVIGQKKATAAVAAAVRRFRLGFAEEGRPNGSFLFLGPTGVGKTLLAKILAQQLFGSEKLLFRYDMSEYSEAFSVSRLIGAPPGYVGYEQPGQLTETVHRHPYCIVLFDELEKAHPDVLRLLLQILEEGELTDNDGRHVDFSHTLVLATSNLGARQAGCACAKMGFNTPAPLDHVPEQVRQFLAPELINRFDEIVNFERLEKPVLCEIARLQLEELRSRLAQRGIEFRFTPEACALLTDKCWQPEYGARPLRRGVKTYVEDPLCLQLLRCAEAEGASAVLEARGDKLNVELRRLSVSV